MTARILIGDCRVRMAELTDASVDSVVCDPPYHLTSIVKRFGSENAAPAKSNGATGVYGRASKGFMGQTWDGGDVAFDPDTWAEVLRVLKPGGHLIAFSGTRTYHRMAVAIEDAGFEIRDQLAWVYGSGFPKSLDVSKQIDKLKDWSLVEKLAVEIKRAREQAGLSLKQIGEAMKLATAGEHGTWYHRGGMMFFETGRSLPSRAEWPHLCRVLPIRSEFLSVYEAAEREVVGRGQSGKTAIWSEQGGMGDFNITAPATDAAREWQGWGTALKPSLEPVCLARKPWTNEQEWVTIRSLIEGLWSALWRVLPANDAVKDSTLNPRACGVGRRASAQWSAERLSNTRADLSEAMDMSRFELALTSSLSTASSWNSTLAELCRAESTSTTETVSSTTIDLRTLRFCLSKITPESIILAHRSGAWSNADACNAARYLSATLATFAATRELSALAPAIAQDRTDSLDAGATPSLAPICLARKPLEGTVAANVLKWGTGALNIDGTRIGLGEGEEPFSYPNGPGGCKSGEFHYQGRAETPAQGSPLGRWPANLCHDGSEEVLAGFPDSDSPQSYVRGADSGNRNAYAKGVGERAGTLSANFGDSGSAARFFYCAKSSSEERGEGNSHPTVKPIALMRWLVRLVTPKGGTVLDPFMGSGSTLLAAEAEQFNAIGCEMSEEYAAIAERRLREAAGMFADVSVCLGVAA